MKTYLSLPVKNNNKGKILHITDTHLFAKGESTLLGVNTGKSFNAVIDEIDKQPHDFDLIVATGDFVQDGSKEAYLRFAKGVKRFSMPCVWLQGNHDIYANMKPIFEQQGLPDNKVVLLGEKWVVILLNSQVEGKAYGMLSPSELEFLSSTLELHRQRYAMVFLHHHPIMSGCRWLDEHSLKNSKDFGEVIKKYKNIRSIGWGHIHQRLETIWHQCSVFSTPSTCVQFKPESYYFSLVDTSPGWRVIELNHDGEVGTDVHYLSKNQFLPDMSKNGY